MVLIVYLYFIIIILIPQFFWEKLFSKIIELDQTKNLPDQDFSMKLS